ncbi:MAG: HlyC/CorC family transporter [Rhodospirillaceae bacterium]|nr:HlyC/CorC family transporter [Rhodospirillales bacterium]
MSEPHSRQPREAGATPFRISRDGGTPQYGFSKAAREGVNDDTLIDTIRGWLRALRRSKGSETVREALEELIEDRDESGIPIDEQERVLLGNILHLRERSAYDVMVPRADIVGVDAVTPLDELSELFIKCGHSRLPVYRGRLDDVIGMVHIKDVLAVGKTDKPVQLHRIVRRVLFVSPSMRVMDMLLEMRLKRTHMALVVDEYGGIDGLVTIEDLVEQIVGEIEDEHDRDVEPDMVVRPDGVIEADARTPIEEFEQVVGQVLTEEEREDVDTLGGLVFFIAGRVPSRGELIAHPSGLEFEVVDADPRRIKWLRVRKVSPQPAPETAG